MTWLILIDLAVIAALVLAVVLTSPLLRRQIRAFGRRFDYDTSYLLQIEEASTPAMLRMVAFQAFAAQRQDLPRDAFYAARIAATMAEDCGPCTQLVTTMAEREGVPPEVLRAILQRDLAHMGESASLAFRFVDAVVARDLVRADASRGEILAKWGPRALVSLAYSIATSRVYPTLKYALGHGRACSRVRVGGLESAVVRSAAE
jgi:hypothetical protein